MSLARKIKRQQMRKANRADMSAFYAHADRVAAGWDKKEKELSEERTLYTFSATLAMCCKVLCRDFPKDFTPLKGKPRKNSRLARFCWAVAEEVSQIDTRTNEGLKRYMDAVYKEYGVRFDYTSEGGQMTDLESQELQLIRDAVQEGLELLREIREELRGRKDDGK